MPKPENISSRNIKYLEIQEHNGDFETVFKSSNIWYFVSHIQGSILDIKKISSVYIDKVISQIQELKYYRIFTPDEEKKYNNTAVPSNRTHVFYDTKMGNPHFYYGEDDKIEVTARQIVQRFNKIKKELNK